MAAAQAGNKGDLARAIASRLTLYRDGKPFHQTRERDSAIKVSAAC